MTPKTNVPPVLFSPLIPLSLALPPPNVGRTKASIVSDGTTLSDRMARVLRSIRRRRSVRVTEKAGHARESEI